MPKTYFISYNKNDLAWAEWIAWVVEDLGNKVIIQAWDFAPGNSWVQEMQNATKKSNSTICVLSKDFLNSGFTTAEWQSAFADDPTGEKRKVIPFRVKECNLDGLLKARICADLVGKDKNTAREMIRSTLMDERRKPLTEPKFPNDHGKEPEFPKTKVKYALVLDAEFDELARKKVEAIIQHLQKTLNDSSISITEITDGSIIVLIDSEYESFFKLQKEFFEKNKLILCNVRIIGIWPLEKNTTKPVNQRLEFYRARLFEFFISKGADKENAQDLAQDVIISLFTNPNKYKYLSSPVLTINLARVAFSKFTQEKNKDTIARKGYVNPTGEVDWDEIYRASRKVLNNLSTEDHFILEQYWNSKFAEGKFDNFTDQEEAQKIDEAVEHEIYINIVDD